MRCVWVWGAVMYLRVFSVASGTTTVHAVFSSRGYSGRE